MNYNYHTHTYRCGHAAGSDEDYIIYAVNHGIKFLGFSDHAPFVCDDGFESNYRIPMEQAENYVKDIKVLKEKYKDKIDIKIGFEMEYYPKDFEKMLKSAIDLGADYLILGEHFTENEHQGGRHSLRPTEDIKDLKEYVSCVVSAIKTGAFTYVAHPDLVNFLGDMADYKKEIKKICEASKEYNIPMEINFLGIRENRNYPNSAFWEVAGEVQCPVTFGCDAHSPEHAFDKESLEKAREMVEQYGLNYIGKPTILSIQH